MRIHRLCASSLRSSITPLPFLKLITYGLVGMIGSLSLPRRLHAVVSNSQLLYASTEMANPNYPSGFSINSTQFLGARFELPQGALIDQIGGHMFSTHANPVIFGAVVRLNSLTDFPDSADLSTPDVLGHVLFSPPSNSADIAIPVGPIDAPPGFYAVVFGSGLFGATGSAAAPDANVPNDATAPYNLKYQSSFGWDRIGNRGVRFTAYGEVPEPAALFLLSPLMLLAARRPRR